MSPIAKPGIYIERSPTAALAAQIHLVDERLLYSLQNLRLEDARNDIFKSASHNVRKRWLRTTVHTTLGWLSAADQPYTGNEVRIHRSYLKDVHIFVNPEKNKCTRKRHGTYTNRDNTNVSCGDRITLLLDTLGFDLCMVHHLDYGNCFVLEVYGRDHYHIYYHKVSHDNLYWLYSTELK